MINRVKTRKVKVGSLYIGGDAPITIQSMTNTKTEDIEGSVKQIKELIAAGCDIVRLSVYSQEAADGFREIRKQIKIPLVADIHFDYRLALEAIKAGADKIRLNPGNIGGEDRVKEVIDACKKANVSVRIGVNSGSLQKDLLKKYGHPTPDALAESAMRYVDLMKKMDFDQFVLSIKASDAVTTIEACEKLSKLTDTPQHIGITEAGTSRGGAIKSAAGLGAILSRGIGDTMRVSLSGDPVEEVPVARDILKAFGLRGGATIVACPTCGRTNIDLAGLAKKVEDMMTPLDTNLHIAVMGCVVNGPGEAKEADIGIAGGVGEGLIFVKGEKPQKYPEDQLLDKLWEIVQQKMKDEKGI